MADLYKFTMPDGETEIMCAGCKNHSLGLMQMRDGETLESVNGDGLQCEYIGHGCETTGDN